MTSGLSGSPAPTTSRRLWPDGFQVFLDQHAPYRRRRAQRRYFVGGDGVQHRPRVEPALIGDEHRRADIPGGEETAPGMLRPAGRGYVQMDVTRQQSQRVHRRKMPDRIGAVRMQHQLRFGRRAGGKIQQQRVIGLGIGIRERIPTTSSADPRSRLHPGTGSPTAMRVRLLSSPSNLPGLGTGGDDMTGPSTLEPVGQIR